MTSAPTTSVWGYEPSRAKQGSWFPLELQGQLDAGAYGGTSKVHTIATAHFRGHAAKIFDPACLSQTRRHELHGKLLSVARMAPLLRNGYMGQGVVRTAVPYVSWPEVLIYSDRNPSPDNLLGFAMPKVVDGHPLMVLATAKHRKRLFGSLAQSDMLGIAAHVADKLCQLHGPDGSRGILFGDLAPRNVLITPMLKLHFIDADSYQYRGQKVLLRSQDSTPGHRSPRIAKAALAGGALPPLTVDDDAYALAILLFYVLVDAAHPFRTGSGFEVNGKAPDDEENMLAGRFVYADATTYSPPRIRFQTYQKLPGAVRQLFEEAFIANKPPSPCRWAKTLSDGRLSKPARTPAAHHFP